MSAAARLYIDSQFTSPYAMSVFVALHEIGLPFDIETVDLNAGLNHTAPFAEISLTRRVPTLIHGDLALSESSAITEYLNELFPAAKLYPQTPQARAKARQVQARPVPPGREYDPGYPHVSSSLIPPRGPRCLVSFPPFPLPPPVVHRPPA